MNGTLKEYIENNLPGMLGGELFGAEAVYEESEDGILVFLKKEGASPVIRLRPGAEDGLPPEVICHRIAEMFTEGVKNTPVAEAERFASMMQDGQWILRHVGCRVRSRKPKEGFLYRKVEDLYLEPVVHIGNMAAMISVQAMRSAGLSEGELFDAAERNTDYSAVVQELPSFMEMIAGGPGGVPEEDERPLYIVTCKGEDGFPAPDGAAVIFCSQKLREKLRDRIGDFFILPSSIHETLCLPMEGTDDQAASGLRAMVREINRETVSEEDFLSDSVYTYTRRGGLKTCR